MPSPHRGFCFCQMEEAVALVEGNDLETHEYPDEKNITGEDMTTVSSTCACTPASSRSSKNVTHHIRASHIHETDEKWACAETAQIGILYVFRQHHLLYNATRTRYNGKHIVAVRYSWLRLWIAPAL